MEPAEEAAPAVDANSGSELDRVYLDLTPVKSFLHSTSEVQVQASVPEAPHQDDVAETLTEDPKPDTTPEEPHTESPGDPEAQQVQTILSTRYPATSSNPAVIEWCVTSLGTEAARGSGVLRTHRAHPENHHS